MKEMKYRDYICKDDQRVVKKTLTDKSCLRIYVISTKFDFVKGWPCEPTKEGVKIMKGIYIMKGSEVVH